jgi:hypothetical protein
MINITNKPIIYTAHSRKAFYAREIISAFTLGTGAVPLNPFMNFGYFLGDRVERNTIRQANDTLISRCDELWQFGDISNGCLAEIQLAENLGKKIRFFTVGKSVEEIQEIASEIVMFEKPELADIAVKELPQYFVTKSFKKVV